MTPARLAAAVNCSKVDRFGRTDAHPELKRTIDSVRTEETALRPTSRRAIVIMGGLCV
jgi:hypothetical protein